MGLAAFVQVCALFYEWLGAETFAEVAQPET
jgi:hypothetical protein